MKMFRFQFDQNRTKNEEFDSFDGWGGGGGGGEKENSITRF